MFKKLCSLMAFSLVVTSNFLFVNVEAYEDQNYVSNEDKIFIEKLAKESVTICLNHFVPFYDNY